ncbi:MAG: hypothetical protein U9R72_13885 [Chloroflexota bacterium]|nr:hypothetical protein [Chloroflexota bacterium]
MRYSRLRSERRVWPPSPGFLALLICCLVVALVMRTHGCDPMAFTLTGERFASGDPSGVKGYDGQFAYYIAVDPAGARDHLDNPAYRYQRILYPLLARFLSLGRPAIVPWALLFINLVSISVSTELLGRLLARHDLSSYLALLLPLWLGQIFALRADLNEPLSYLLVIAALWWYERERYTLSAAAIAASALAKEAGLLFLPPIVLVMVLRKRWSLALRYVVIVCLPYLLLQIGLYYWIGRSGLAGAGGRFERIPFYGFTFSEPLPARVFLILIFVLPVTALLVLGVRQLLETPRSVYAWALLVNCLFVVFLPRRTTVDVLAVFRVATGVIVAALLFSAAHERRRVAWVLHAVWLPPTMLAFMIPGFLV